MKYNYKYKWKIIIDDELLMTNFKEDNIKFYYRLLFVYFFFSVLWIKNRHSHPLCQSRDSFIGYF